VNRLAIYAAFGIPEVWRFDGEKVRFYRLGKENSYDETEKSHAFPFLSPSVLDRFISRRTTRGENRLMQEFRHWVRKNLLKGGPGEKI